MRFFFPVAWWDKFSRGLVLAVRSLWLHKLRTLLSVTGIIIGTAAVIVMTAIGEGNMQEALEDIARQGATNVIITSQKPTEDAAGSRRAWVINYGLTYADNDNIPFLVKSAIRTVPMRNFDQEVRYLNRSMKGRIVGTTKQYAEINQFEMAEGRFLVDADSKDSQNVAVLGAVLANYLFPFEDPLNKTILINNKMPFRVVGVVGDRVPTGSSSGKVPEEFNNDVYIPLKTNEGRFGDKVILRQSGSRSGEQIQLHRITVTIDAMDHVREAGDTIRDYLKRTHAKNDWDVTIPLDRLEEAERVRDRYMLMLAFIASISLFVGGIGIMNIMLATVTERTREIGVRRALGAKRRDIVMQFLIEAMVQTSLGGLMGLGAGLIFVVGMQLSGSPAKLHVPWTMTSIGASIVVGVLFGLYPAWRASRLDPIEALRQV